MYILFFSFTCKIFLFIQMACALKVHFVFYFYHLVLSFKVIFMLNVCVCGEGIF